MIDDTPAPYIIVDNRKIQPISRSPRPHSAADETRRDQEQNFGVVDRVTISREGLEKSRQQDNEDLQPLPEKQTEQITDRRLPMLTYSPKGKP
jgi:hypothetical protein